MLMWFDSWVKKKTLGPAPPKGVINGSFYERPPKGTPWEVLGEHPCFVHFPKSPNQAECSVFRSEGAH